MADKLLVGSLVVSLSFCDLFPIWLSAMVIFRDLFLIVAGFVIRYISLPPPVSQSIFLAVFRIKIESLISIQFFFFRERLQDILMQHM